MTRPLLLGHRGARSSRHIPENTLASFELCLQHGCDGFEFDVRRSADGQAVVCHDPVVHGMEVARTPAANLGLPALTEVLRSFGGRAFLDIELKVGGLEREIVTLLREHSPGKGYVISSFLPEALTVLHGFDPNIPLGLLCETREELGHWQEVPVMWVILQFGLADEAAIKQLHEAGKKVMLWTVNQASEMRKLAARSVDAIISDDTELAVKVLTGV